MGLILITDYDCSPSGWTRYFHAEERVERISPKGSPSIQIHGPYEYIGNVSSMIALPLRSIITVVVLSPSFMLESDRLGRVPRVYDDVSRP
jgi:hypothetical protein